jgi:hypothetical protein
MVSYSNLLEHLDSLENRLRRNEYVIGIDIPQNGRKTCKKNYVFDHGKGRKLLRDRIGLVTCSQ